MKNFDDLSEVIRDRAIVFGLLLSQQEAEALAGTLRQAGEPVGDSQIESALSNYDKERHMSGSGYAKEPLVLRIETLERQVAEMQKAFQKVTRAARTGKNKTEIVVMKGPDAVAEKRIPFSSRRNKAKG